MNRFLIACLACLILFLMFPIGVAAQQSGYIGLGGGSSTWDLGDAGGFPEVDDSDTSIKLFGGFNLGENFAIELAYADLGEASGSAGDPAIAELTFTLEATAISAALAGQLPLGETFALFGKLGMAFWDAELSFDFTILGVPQPPPFPPESDTGFDPLVGVGLMLTPGETFALRLEFERYLDVTEDVDVDVLSASVLFPF